MHSSLPPSSSSAGVAPAPGSAPDLRAPFVPARVTAVVTGSRPDVIVPFTDVKLSDGATVRLNTVAGLKPGSRPMPPRAAAWCPSVPDGAARKVRRTQLARAKAGEITAHMEYAAIRESGMSGPDMPFTPETVRAQVAAGLAVLPANVNHPEAEPMLIGRAFSVKINANIGASAVSSNFESELDKLRLSLRWGADTVMDLSAGLAELMPLREAILRASPVPIGTVPVYEALDRAGGNVADLSWEIFRQTLLDQARQGVDYFTVHAGLTRRYLPAAARRRLGIVSRGGAIMAAMMLQRDCENPAYAHFDEVLQICRDYDVALSLGDGMRPGCLADAGDEAQYGELKTIGELAARCFEADVQCFIEGPGHVPLDKIEENQRLQEQYCRQAPFYTLGPLVTDIAPGYDHVTAAIGGAEIARLGTAMLCYVTPAEHLSLPTAQDVKAGIIAFKLAAHAADVAKGLPGARLRDDAMARARAGFRWYDQFSLSLDPEHAYAVWASRMPENCGHEPSFCSMCGPRFCPIRLNRQLKERVHG